MKHGITAQGKQRYRCKHPSCPYQTFLVEYSHHGRVPEVKQQILEMTLNGSGIRDIARVLHISPTTVIEELKKEPQLQHVNELAQNVGGDPRHEGDEQGGFAPFSRSGSAICSGCCCGIIPGP
jgi:hypothetical protein